MSKFLFARVTVGGCEKFRVKLSDCRVDTFRVGGKGGQNQNKVESGVRVTHLPSKAVGEARDSRDQIRNKRSAFRRMVASPEFRSWVRVELARHGVELPEHERRVSQKGEKIRTYDYKRKRVTDHTTGLEYDLQKTLDGELPGIRR